VIRRKKRPDRKGLDDLVSETGELVGKLLRENRALKARNLKLSRELERVSAGWEAIKKLARSAPRRARR